MSGITQMRTVGTGLSGLSGPSWAPATPHATFPAFDAGVLPGRAVRVRPVVVAGPIDDDKYTGASVPGRRGGT